MKKCLVAPDSFKGTLSATEVCHEVEDAFAAAMPNATPSAFLAEFRTPLLTTKIKSGPGLISAMRCAATTVATN